MHRVFIDGAAGTTGLEIRARLEGRGEFELILLDEARRKDGAARRAALHAADIAILCLPDEAAKEAVRLAEGAATRIIDASSDAIANARFVSNPGCYPTGFLALVAPLVRAGLIPADWPFTVHAVSGYSGGGTALIARFEAEPDIAFRAYGLGLAHKHLPEMQAHAGLARPPVFSPAVIPAHRGMVVEVPLALAAIPGRPDPAALHAALAAAYAQSPVVRLAPLGPAPAELLLSKSAAPWDGLHLHVFAAPDGAQARLVAVLDNLGKGASGAAIQNLNLMCGLPETAGLVL